MKQIALALLAIAAFSAAPLAAQEELAATAAPSKKHGLVTKGGYTEISTEGLKNLIQSGKPFVLLDARTPKYDDGNRIPGAIFLPFNSTAEAIQAAAPDKEQLVVVYCTNYECPASKWLADILVKMGYKNVKKYADGLDAWMAAGNDVEQAS